MTTVRIKENEPFEVALRRFKRTVEKTGLLDVGVAGDIVSKTGAWFNFGEVRLGQGREQSKEFLKANPTVAAEIDAKIRAATATLDVPVAPPGDGE